MRNFFICFLSGLATSLGYFFCFLKIDKNKLITATLAFAASIMFFISIFELIPEGIAFISNKSIFKIIIFFAVGFLIALSINNIIKDENKLYRVGIYTSIGLIIHNLLEGFITFLTLKLNAVLGLKLAISIALHNIPEGISVAIPLFYSGKGQKKLLFYMILLSMSEIIGAFLAFTLFKNGVKVVGELYLVIAGIMTYIAIFELLKESLSYKMNKLVLKSILLGLIIIITLKMI